MRKIIALIFFSLFLNAAAFAWDDTGHKITAKIAWQNMTPAAREKAVKLLLEAPEDSGILNLFASDSRSFAARQEAMFVTASTWADLVRDDKYPVRKKNYHHGTWHYTDTFFRQNNNQIVLVEELKPDPENAVERLFVLEKIVKDAAKPAAERAVALAWILHIAGDIHQPLHAVARVTELEPKGDQGGNLVLLGAPDKEKRPDNLHWFWDSILSRDTARTNGDEGDATYIPRLTEIVVKKHPAQSFTDRAKNTDFSEWQQESFRFATKHLYPATLVRNQPPTEEYRKNSVKIAEERLALAGLRIAELLNRIFV